MIEDVLRDCRSISDLFRNDPAMGFNIDDQGLLAAMIIFNGLNRIANGLDHIVMVLEGKNED